MQPPTEANAAIGTVLERCRALLSDESRTPTGPREIDPAQWPRWLKTLAADGRWPDIDYESRNGGAWPALDHLRRVKVFAQIWARVQAKARTIDVEKSQARSPAPDDLNSLGNAIHRALGFWTSRRFQNPNWWQNQIGVPQVMADILVLFGDELDGEERAGAFAVLHQLVVRSAGEGANTVWSAGLGLMAALLECDEAALVANSRLIAGEVVVGREQGIQDDFSFHQHGARLQEFHYGGSFLADTVRFAWILRGTPWGFPAEKSKILADYALEGCAWMCRGRVTVPSTIDRAASRPGFMDLADLRPVLRQLCELVPARLRDLQAFLACQDGAATHSDAAANPGETAGDGAVAAAASREAAVGVGAAPDGFRAFPTSDFATFHTPDFSFFVKTVSLRTELSESILGENLKGRKLNWGDHYILRHGAEYRALPPVWDWDLLPGVTSTASRTAKLRRQAFVGAIEHGKSGAAAMELRLGSESADTFSARKFWAAHGGAVVALTGAISADSSEGAVRTALDQCALSGPVVVGHAGGRVSNFAVGEHALSEVNWIYHAGLVYRFLAPAQVTLVVGTRTGSWYDINRNYSNDRVALPVFLPIWEHVANCPPAQGYVITACAGPAAAEALAAAKPSIGVTSRRRGQEVLRADVGDCSVLNNTAACQSVEFGDGAWFAAFYRDGALTTRAGTVIAVDRACLLSKIGSALVAADPTQTGGRLEVTLDGRRHEVLMPPRGRTLTLR